VKRINLLVVFILFLFCFGCAPAATVVPSATPTQTAQSLLPSINTTDTVTPEIVPTETPIISSEPSIDVFGYVDSVDGDNVTVVICELIFHLADDLDKFGEIYGHDWMEIVHTEQTVNLKVPSYGEYVYADLFSLETDYDGKYKMKNISNNEFLSVCIKEYYNTPLYFNFVYSQDTLTYAELYLDYYIAG
jgi:hypothetical protein